MKKLIIPLALALLVALFVGCAPEEDTPDVGNDSESVSLGGSEVVDEGENDDKTDETPKENADDKTEGSNDTNADSNGNDDSWTKTY